MKVKFIDEYICLDFTERINKFKPAQIEYGKEDDDIW